MASPCSTNLLAVNTEPPLSHSSQLRHFFVWFTPFSTNQQELIRETSLHRSSVASGADTNSVVIIPGEQPL